MGKHTPDAAQRYEDSFCTKSTRIPLSFFAKESGVKRKALEAEAFNRSDSLESFCPQKDAFDLLSCLHKAPPAIDQHRAVLKRKGGELPGKSCKGGTALRHGSGKTDDCQRVRLDRFQQMERFHILPQVDDAQIRAPAAQQQSQNQCALPRPLYDTPASQMALHLRADRR